MLSKPDLFSRLAEGHAASITVVTPNTRLSQALVSDFDDFQINENQKTSWEAADILPFGAFVSRLYEDALYSDIKAALPMLLTPAQEQELWKQIVAKSGLLSVDETAARCRDAWSLMHEWRVRPGEANDDTAAFLSWKNTYEKRTSSEVDAARLPDLVAEHLKELKKPKLVVAYAFDILAPQTQEFFNALSSHGVEVLQCFPEKKNASCTRAVFSSAKEELQKAAEWARARLEANPAARIGVVVPELEERRKEVARVFSRTMRPGYNLPGTANAPMPFNISLGLPLKEYPLIHAALTLLEFSKEEISFDA